MEYIEGSIHHIPANKAFNILDGKESPKKKAYAINLLAALADPNYNIDNLVGDVLNDKLPKIVCVGKK